MLLISITHDFYLLSHTALLNPPLQVLFLQLEFVTHGWLTGSNLLAFSTALLGIIHTWQVTKLGAGLFQRANISILWVNPCTGMPCSHSQPSQGRAATWLWAGAHQGVATAPAALSWSTTALPQVTRESFIPSTTWLLRIHALWILCLLWKDYSKSM